MVMEPRELHRCSGTVIARSAMGSTLAMYRCPGTIFCTGAGGGSVYVLHLKSFVIMYELMVLMALLVHAKRGGKEFSCDKCDYSTIWWVRLKKHVGAFHAGNWADEPLNSPLISQGNTPKKESSGGKERHSSIERYRPEAKSESKIDNLSPIGTWADEPMDSPPILQGQKRQRRLDGQVAGCAQGCASKHISASGTLGRGCFQFNPRTFR